MPEYKNSLFHFVNALELFVEGSNQNEQVIELKRAIEMGLSPIEGVIAQGILIRIFAQEGDFEKAQNQIFVAREYLGKFIGLNGIDLESFSNDHEEAKIWFHYPQNKINFINYPSEFSIFSSLNSMISDPIKLIDTISDAKKKEFLLNSWINDWNIEDFLLLLSDYYFKLKETDKAMFYFNKVKNFNDNPGLEAIFRIRLALVYKQNEDIISCKNELIKAIHAESDYSKNFRFLGDEEDEEDNVDVFFLINQAVDFYIKKAKNLVSEFGDIKSIEKFEVENKKKGSCFIATVVYGSPYHKEVLILKSFRDSYLCSNSIGKFVIEIYYRISPSISNILNSNLLLKKIIKILILDQIVKIIKKFNK